jgi:hypothetical protein
MIMIRQVFGEERMNGVLGSGQAEKGATGDE